MISFYDLVFTANNGTLFSFDTLRGKKVLLVNTASACGFTPQYAALEELYRRYKSDGLEILAFPSNDFGEQEPGSDEEIAEFCEVNFEVSFPLMTKSHVKGPTCNVVYRWLTDSGKALGVDPTVTWNFQKFGVNEKGILEKIFVPAMDPLHQEVAKWLTQQTLF